MKMVGLLLRLRKAAKVDFLKIESFTPKELDIPFTEITKINIGRCPGTETHYREVSPFEAHTHMCKIDPYFKSICIYYKDYLFNSDGSISDILWHEYAHVLDTYNQDSIKIVSCNSYNGMHQFEYPSKVELELFGDTSGHGKSWESIMRKLGKVPARTVAAPSRV